MEISLNKHKSIKTSGTGTADIGQLGNGREFNALSGYFCHGVRHLGCNKIFKGDPNKFLRLNL